MQTAIEEARSLGKFTNTENARWKPLWQILAIAKYCHYPLWYPEPLDYRHTSHIVFIHGYSAITSCFRRIDLGQVNRSKSFPHSSSFMFVAKFSCLSPTLKLCQWIPYHGDSDLGCVELSSSFPLNFRVGCLNSTNLIKVKVRTEKHGACWNVHHTQCILSPSPISSHLNRPELRARQSDVSEGNPKAADQNASFCCLPLQGAMFHDVSHFKPTITKAYWNQNVNSLKVRMWHPWISIAFIILTFWSTLLQGNDTRSHLARHQEVPVGSSVKKYS